MFRSWVYTAFVVLCFAPSSVMATAATLGRIQCTSTKQKAKAKRLSIHWGQSCAPGGPCSSMLSMELFQGGKGYSLTTQAKVSPKARRQYEKRYKAWLTKNARVFPPRRVGRPRLPSRVKLRICSVGKKRYYRYSFRDWRGRWMRVEIKPASKGLYRVRVRDAYNPKARTKGWLKHMRCSFGIARQIPSCRKSKKKKPSKR